MKKWLSVILLLAMVIQLLPNLSATAEAAYTDSNWQELLTKWKNALCGDDSIDWEDGEIKRILEGTNSAGVSVAGISFHGGNSWTQLEKNRNNPDRVVGDTPVIVSTPSAVMGDQFVHLQRMARAYSTRNTVYHYLNEQQELSAVNLYQNPDLREAIFFGLEKCTNYFTWDRWWEQINHSTATETYNWWDWAYNAELHLGQALIMMQPYESAEEEQIANTLLDTALRLVNRIRPNTSPYGDQTTYENRRTRLNITPMIAALTKNTALMEETRTNLADFMITDQSLLDGVKSDDSYICHHYFAMEGTYGRDVLIERIIDTYCILAGTAFEPDSPNKFNQFHWIMDTFAQVMHNGVLFSMNCGREPTLGLSAGANVVSGAIQLIGCFGEAEDLALKQLIRSAVVQDTYDETLKAYSRYAVAIGEVNQVGILKSVVFDQSIADGPKEYAAMRYATDRAVQHRENYSVGLAMSSNRIATHESIRGRNRFGWYTGDGALYVYNDYTSYNYDQYGDIFQRFANKYRMPGTTEEDSTTRQPWSDRYHYLPGMEFRTDTSTKSIYWEPHYHEDGTPVGSFVGGAELEGQYIAAAFDFEAYNWDEEESRQEVALIDCYTSDDEYLEEYKMHQVIHTDLKAQKSYFMFDDEIVCVGSDIDYSTTGVPIHTYVDNRELMENSATAAGTVYGAEDIIVDGTMLEKVNSFSAPKEFIDPSWIYAENFGGYVFPQGGDVYVNKTYRESSNDGNDSNDDFNAYYLGIKPINKKISFLELWLNHGSKPQNETYSYVMLPEMSAEETQTYAKNPDITVVTATDKLHVVKENTLGITAMIFWRAGTYEGITVNKPMVVMIREQDGTYSLTASDPTQKLTSATLTVNRSLSPIRLDDGITLSKSNQTVLTFDLAGSQGKTFAAEFSTERADSLHFDFNTQTAPKYFSYTYGFYDYSQSQYWATGNIGGTEGTVADGAMTFPLTEGYYSSGEPMVTTNIEPSDSVKNYAPTMDATKANVLRYDPKNAEIFLIRFKLNDAQAYGTATPNVAMYYLPQGADKWSGASNSAADPNPWYDPIILGFSKDYVDGGTAEGQYLTLSASLENSKISTYDLIQGLMISFGNMRGGCVTVDQIYVGPKTEHLYFGFERQPQGSDTGAYGGYRFNSSENGNWAVACSEKSGDHYEIDHTDGTLTLYVTDDYNGESPKQYGPYLETTASAGVYPWSNQDLHPLSYTPEKAEILQVRFKTEGVVADGTQQPVLIALFAAQKDGTLTRYADSVKTFAIQNGAYQTVTIVLKENFTQAEAISSLGLRFRNIKSENAQSMGNIQIDYIYVGSKAAAPSKGLYFDFTDTQEDQARYDTHIYGNTNFDTEGWSYCARTNAPVFDRDSGTMSTTLLPDASGALYVQTSESLYSNFPLDYDPSGAEVVQIRFKLENFRKSGSPAISMYYYEAEKNLRNNIDSIKKLCTHSVSVEDLTSGKYLTLTMAVTDAFRKAEKISALRVNFSGMASISNSQLGTFTIDYIYVGSKAALPSQDHLFFDFTNTGDDQERYDSRTYRQTNLDIADNWTRQNSVTRPVITKGELSYMIGTDSTSTYHYIHCGKGFSAPLQYLPGQEDVCQVRFKVTDAVSTASNGMGQFMLYYGVGESGALDFDYVNFPMEDVVDNGYITLTFPMDKETYLTAEYIGFIRPQFSNLKSVEGKQASFTIDYIYIGRQAGCPGEDHLFFDFDNSHEASARYMSRTYSGINFDLAENWTRQGSVTDLKVEEGSVSFRAGGNSTVNYHYIHTGAAFGMPLQYTPGKQDYCQVRIKIQDAVATTENGKGRFMLYYGINDNSSASGNFDYVDFDLNAVVDRGYFTLTFPIDAATYGKANQINYIRPQFSNMVSAEGKQATFYVDYIYIGEKEGVPSEDHLFFDFDNSAQAKERYEGKIYGGINFDLQENWTKQASVTQPLIENGNLSYAIGPESTGNYHYVHTGKNFTNPLHFTPGKEDYCQIRVKVEDVVSTATNKTGRFMLYFGTNEGSAPGNGFDYVDFDLSAYGNKGYFTLTFPLDAAAYMGANQITYIRPQFSNLKSESGKKGSFTIDYLYIGPKASLPLGMYEVRFVGEDGKLLQSKTVFSGETAVYTGAVPTKAYDGTYHYSFKGWDQPLGPVTGDLTLRAQFTPVKHSLTYTQTDAHTHKESCTACGYTKEAPHSYADGTCLCGHVEIKEPVMESGWKLGHTLNLASDISVNLAVSKSYLEGFDMSSVYVLVELDTYEGNTKTGVKTVELRPVEQGSYYYFTLMGLTAINMNDSIRSVLYGTKDGQEHYSPVDVYSIAQYAYGQMDKAIMPDSLKTLCADLLRYGAKAQILKGYRIDSLADGAMTEAHKAYLSDMETVTFGNTNKVLEDLPAAPITWVGKALNLESKIALKLVYRNASYTGDLTKVSARISYEDVEGKIKTLTLTNAEVYNAEKGLYAFTVDCLLAAELRSVVSAQIFEGETPLSATLQYAPDAYGNNKSGAMLELCKALFAYVDSASAYFQSLH